MSPETAASATPESAIRSTAEQITTRHDIDFSSGLTGLSSDTRATGPLITGYATVQDVWPHVAKRLSASLRQRGASTHDTDDLVQECALRLLSREVPFTDAGDLLTWCFTVVRHAHIDLHRGRARLMAEAVPDLPATVDVHDEVVARLRLQSVVKAWPQMSALDRRVLAQAVQEMPTPAPRREAVRLYVQRNRARQRLHALIAALVWILGLVGRSVRRQVMPLTALTAAAVAVVTLARLPTPPHGAGEVQESPVALSPPASFINEAVVSFEARLIQPILALPKRQPSVTGSGRPGPKSSARMLASTQAPGGYGAEVTSHDRPASGGGLICVGDLPALPDTCVPDPTASTSSLGRFSLGPQ